MAGEMEPKALNVTLSLWSVGACWRTCLEPRQAMRDGKRKIGIGELDGKTEQISKRATLCVCVLM